MTMHDPIYCCAAVYVHLADSPLLCCLYQAQACSGPHVTVFMSSTITHGAACRPVAEDRLLAMVLPGCRQTVCGSLMSITCAHVVLYMCATTQLWWIVHMAGRRCKVAMCGGSLSLLLV